MIEVKKYIESDKKLWDNFILLSKNGNFLFLRDYMDYHKDRFIDHSLIFSKNNNPIAVLPAIEKGRDFISHGGLTFGGLIMSRDIRTTEVLEIFELLCNYCIRNSFQTIIYKIIPFIFCNYPAQEDQYALFRYNAKLIKRDISSVLSLQENKIRFPENKRQSVAKCEKMNVKVVESNDFSAFWELLVEVLSKFDVKPVHSLQEITYLKSKMHDKIKLYEARLNDSLLAGILIYDYDRVVHTQYMANSIEGRKARALDYVNYMLINKFYVDRKYYSWGISTEEGGKILNEGLIRQKEEMGGRSITLDTYRIDL